MWRSSVKVSAFFSLSKGCRDRCSTAILRKLCCKIASVTLIRDRYTKHSSARLEVYLQYLCEFAILPIELYAQFSFYRHPTACRCCQVTICEIKYTYPDCA